MFGQCSEKNQKKFDRARIEEIQRRVAAGTSPDLMGDLDALTDYFRHIGRVDKANQLSEWMLALAEGKPVDINFQPEPFTRPTRKFVANQIASAAAFAFAFTVLLSAVGLYSNLGAVFDWGVRELDAQRPRNAVYALSVVYVLNPKWQHVLFYLGNAHTDLEEPALALKDYKKALKLDPDDGCLYNNIGNCYDKLNKDEKALRSYNKGIELDPSDYNHFLCRGEFFYNHEEYDKALLDLNKAIELNPNDSDGYYYRGLTYSALGKEDLAEKDNVKAEELGHTTN